MYYSIINISEDKENPKHVICYKDLPLYYPNQFLNRKGLNSSETRKAYAKILVRFFNFIEDTYGITDYREIKHNGAIEAFMNTIIYDSVIDLNGNKKYLYESETLITPSTANNYMSRIQVFYLLLEKPMRELIDFDSDYIEKMLKQKQKNIIKQKTSYKGIWAVLDLSELNLHQNTKWKDKHKKKQSFTKQEVALLVKNLRNISIRDECIFLTCVETGTRIGEAITAFKRNFKPNSEGIWTLGITTSKTKLRYVAIHPYLAKKINNYINTERRRATKNLTKHEYLFVSSKGETKGERISYDTFRNHLKQAGKVAGMDINLIMTV